MKILRYLLDLFYPPLCAGCGEVLEGKQEQICSACLTSLPLTEHAIYSDNKVSGLFVDFDKVVKAAAFCYYNNESGFYQMIHALKYYNQPQVGVLLGRKTAECFIKQNPNWFAGIDFIIPVPLHRKRLASRGYNQSEMIAEGISQIAGIPIDVKHLLRTINNPSQTQRSAEERKQNAEGIFSLVNSAELHNKHILLVDDIVTTGATLRSCCKVLKSVRGLKISIISLGMAVEGQKHLV